MSWKNSEVLAGFGEWMFWEGSSSSPSSRAERKGCQQAVAPNVELSDTIRRGNFHPTGKPNSLTWERPSQGVRGLGAGARMGGLESCLCQDPDPEQVNMASLCLSFPHL